MRRTATAVVLLLAAVLPAVAVSSWWAYGQATDTARFVPTARPLATDRTVQRAVTRELVAAADAHLGALPVSGTDGIAAARARVRTLAEALVTTRAYRQSLLATLRTTHARLAARLDGDVDAPLRLDLGRVGAVLRTRVAAAGLPEVAAAIRDPDPVTVADRAQVRRAHEATGLVRIARAISIPGAVLALLAVLLTAPRLASGLLRAAGCLAVATLLLVAGRYGGRELISSSGASSDVAVAVYDVLSRPLRSWTISGAAAALAFALAGGVLSAARRR